LKNPALKKTLTILGNIFTLAAVFYLLVTLFENANRITFVFSSVVFPVMLLLCCTHLIHTYIIQLLLNKKIGYRALLKIHCVSQVYKYVPGNIAHYFSRWVYLKRWGVDARDNARLIVYETSLLVTAFGLLGVLFFAAAPWPFAVVSLQQYGLIAAVGLAVVAATGCFYRRKVSQLFSVKMLPVLLLYILSALLSGLILSLLAVFILPEIKDIGFCAYVSGFAVSFLAGFVVPGSPGGIGIREVVFVKLFTYSGNEAFLLSQLMVVYRLAAVAAELLMYCTTRIFIKDTA